ncbi:MAG: histidinol-phosphatase [Myxococcales bacterium]|nr:histidinol-phosphatase [Myxococcales bacterium]
MPWFSYHGGHSGQYCRHAKGKLADVVRTAVERGFTHYGLSEHCPRDRQQDLYPGEEDLGPSGLLQLFEEYMDEARRLQEVAAGQLNVLVGFETEHLPSDTWLDRMQGLRAELAPDYIVGSVHDVEGTWVDFSPEMTRAAADAAGGFEALHVKYFEAVADLATRLQPQVVGHIDLVRKFDGEHAGFGPRAMAACERALEATRAVGAVLDVNPGAHRRGLSPIYPLPAILHRARAMGVGVTLGDDGHGPHDVGVGLDACMRAIAEAGYTEVCYFERRDGQVARATSPIEAVHPARRSPS